ncbi:MAG: hypothetical protein Q8P62_02180 [Candidatus Peregrinibacteria bacterium]|nr:hypothetical protein [Candidatus Peregrinibacteria bacterium]
MKLKVLFILPVLALNALWWAPFAMANGHAPVGGGELGIDYTEKDTELKAIQADISKLTQELATLTSELSVLQSQLDGANSDYAQPDDLTQKEEQKLKANEADLAQYQEDAACKNNSSGALCSGLKKKTTEAKQALYDSMDPIGSAKKKIDKLTPQVSAKNDAVKAKQAELDAKIKQLDDYIKGLGGTGANSQNLNNYGKGGTILPDTAYQEISDCEVIMRYVDSHPVEMETAISGRSGKIDKITVKGTNPSYTDILGCAIKTGDVKFWMVPYFARYMLEFIIGIAGLASVAGVVYGGYLYLFAGLSDDQQKGKNAIKNSIIALILTLSAWAIVNIVISAVTDL